MDFNNNILLVIPRIAYEFLESNCPPIGILYVSSAMKQAGLNVIPLNLILEEGNIEDLIIEKIKEHNIKFVATGGLVANYREVKIITDVAKKTNPEIVTIIGGGLVTYSAKEAMTIVNTADYGVIGEGEITDVELIKTIINDGEILNVDGIIYRCGDEFKLTNTRADIKDLDTLPWPDYESFQYFEVIKKGVDVDKLFTPITTSRSCPFKCTFCSRKGAGSYRQRSLPKVFEEMDFLIKEYGVKGFTVSDELFAHNINRVHEFCDVIKEKNIKWQVFLRIGKNITLDLLTRMKDAGCITIFYGLESGCDEVLESMNKKITTDEILRVLKITKEAKLQTDGLFIFGDTVETLETAQTTLDWVYENVEFMENISFTGIRLFPGSALYDKAVEDGKIKDTVQFIIDDCPLTNVSKMTDAEYKKLMLEIIPLSKVKVLDKLYKEVYKGLDMTICANENYSNIKDYVLELNCIKCNCKNTYTIDSKFLFAKPVSCKKCNESYSVSNSFYFEKYESKITNILKRDDVAIWGAFGRFFPSLYMSNEYLRDNDIILIDSSPIIQENGYQGKKVYPSSIIKERNIKFIVSCMNNMATTEVQEIIKRDYPQVQTFIRLSEIGLLDN